MPGQGGVPDDGRPAGLQPGGVGVDARHPQSGVGLARRPEVLLDPQVQLHRPGPEPAPAPPGELGRFRYLGHAEDADVVRPQPLLAAGRGGELDVVEGGDHQLSLRATANTRRKGNGVPCGPAG
ncbi:hypothetical protein GCM10010228_52940 [Streptomyces massasporeus]|nr:hypothetical protein GCM10010228_52940 [Streptomyces massasporeus]